MSSWDQRRRIDMQAVAKIVSTAVPLLPPDADPVVSVETRRKAIADFCRFVGANFNRSGESNPPDSPPRQIPNDPISSPAIPVEASNADRIQKLAIDLPPRLQQTLTHLLNGDSEKQVALKLNISKHTVHVYVKSLYKKFDVNSRGELLAKCLRS